MKNLLKVLALPLAMVWWASANRGNAAESAIGVYLLGSTTTNAGIVPPPGTYLQSYNYIYSGNTDVELAIAGLILSGGIEAHAYVNLTVPLWVAPGKILGGHIGVLLLPPVGWKDVKAGASLTGPLGNTIDANLENEETRFGDPVPGAVLGWHHGYWHWKVQGLLNVPIGFWERGNLANLGFNRWAVDTSGAVTWLDPKIGLELSAAVGLTYNFENPTTNYKTGTEFHVEYAAVQNFSKSFALGVNGYFYDQVSGDSGPGARLGSFQGRAAAIGPVMNLNFQVGRIPVAANLKYFREFEVENRLQGDVGFVDFTIPLSPAGK